jgi:hypothetical protein
VPSTTTNIIISILIIIGIPVIGISAIVCICSQPTRESTI